MFGVLLHGMWCTGGQSTGSAVQCRIVQCSVVHGGVGVDVGSVTVNVGVGVGVVRCGVEWFAHRCFVVVAIGRSTHTHFTTVVLQALGYMASTPAGVTRVLDSGPACSRWGDLSASGTRDVRIAVLHSLAVAYDSPHTPTEQLSDLFSAMFTGTHGGRRFDALLSLQRQFDTELRLAAYHLYQALAAHQWGAVALAQTQGFLPWLTNRENERDKVTLCAARPLPQGIA